jgi:hypothetical protein
VVIFYGGCRPVLLLEPTRRADFSDWELSDEAMWFETGPRGETEVPLIGPVENAPTALERGDWTVGLGIWQIPDSGPEYLAVPCRRSFTVEPGTTHVEIGAHFEARCWIDVVLDGVPMTTTCSDQTFFGLDDAAEDRIETKTYPEAHLVTVTVTAIADPNYTETATLDYEDPACLRHRLIGPVLRGVLEGFEPALGKSAPLVGRLILPNAGVGCSMLLDVHGLTWDMMWPDGYVPTFAVNADPPGLIGPDGELVGQYGDLIGVSGREVPSGRRGCAGRGGFRVTKIAFTESTAD